MDQEHCSSKKQRRDGDDGDTFGHSVHRVHGGPAFRRNWCLEIPRYNRRRAALVQQIVSFCCERKAKVLALGGDILDKPNPRPETIMFLRDQFDQLQEAEVQVVYILGQHDGRQNWPLIHKHPIHLHNMVLDIDELSICGLDYMRPAEFMEAYASLKRSRGRRFSCFTRCSRSLWATCDRPR